MSDGAEDELRRLLAGRVAAGWMPGACWWVEDRAGVRSRGAVGDAARVPEREPADERIPYDLGSLTKPLATAPLALLAARAGRLDLRAPIVGVLGELAGSAYAEATAVDLATHRAGLPAWRPLYLEDAALDGFVRRIAEVPPAVERGATLYSDLGYILLGALLQRVEGRTLDELFARRIAGPLGLRRIGFATAERRFVDAAPTERGNAYEREMAGAAGRSHPWRTHVLRGEVHDANAHALGGCAGHAGLFGTLEETAAVARELLSPERLSLAADGRRMLLERQGAAGSRTFGLECAGSSPAARGALPDDAPGHTGFPGTSLWLDPPRGCLYLLLTNRVHPTVQARGLQPVRHAFHRAAAALCGAP